MKVVIFCGGLGVRMGEETQRIPKPMIADRRPPDPLAHHAYYAAWGHDEFILCLGYKGEVHQASTSSTTTRRCLNDFVLERDATARELELAVTRHLDNWRITFVDTGLNVDDRRAAARPSSRTSATTRTSSRRTATGSPMRRCPT